jgi:GNAT superfamily N-acetyltransferase
MRVRERTSADLSDCVELARVVHVNDGYPVYLPEDLRSFMAVPDAIGVWVADQADEVVGHVALRPDSSSAVMTLAEEATGLPAAKLGVIARLLVSPVARRMGVGRSLLEAAANQAAQLGLWPILDVVVQHEAAIRLYEEAGWTRAGIVTVTLGRNVPIEEIVFLGPRPQT